MHTSPGSAANLTVARGVQVGSDAAWIMVPKYQQTLTRHLVIHCHAMNEPSQDFFVTDPRQRSMTSALLGAGYIVAASNAAGNNWGNQAALTAYADLYTAITNLGYTIGKTVLLGVSMGGIAALLTYAAGTIPGMVGFIGICPACNLAQSWESGSFDAAIKAAYGIASDGSDYKAKTSGHDPALLAGATWNGKRLRFYASPEDNVVPKATHSDALSALASGAAKNDVVSCSGAHGDSDQYRAADVLSTVNSWVAA